MLRNDEVPIVVVLAVVHGLRGLRAVKLLTLPPPPLVPVPNKPPRFCGCKQHVYLLNSRNRGAQERFKRKEAELGSHSWMDCLAAELFLSSCFSDTVFTTLFRTAVETAISGIHKLLGTGAVSMSLLFWRWLTVSSVFAGRSTWTSYSPPPVTLLSQSLTIRMVSVDGKHHVSE